MVALQKFVVEKIAVKLYGYLFYFPAFTFVGKPAMLHVRSNEHEFDIADLFNMVANNTLGISCIYHEV